MKVEIREYPMGWNNWHIELHFTSKEKAEEIKNILEKIKE